MRARFRRIREEAERAKVRAEEERVERERREAEYARLEVEMKRPSRYSCSRIVTVSQSDFRAVVKVTPG